MNHLIDDCLILIFKYLNLNERAQLRLVCKKFRFFIDKIIIKKLIIFHNIPTIPGRLKLKRNERYCLGDTVYVTKWEKFILDEWVQKHFLKFLEKLVILGIDKPKLNFYDLNLDKLNYLELHDIRIDEKSKFLDSNNIRSLYLYYRDKLDYFRRDLDDIEKMDRKLGLFRLLNRLKKLKHLNVRNKLTIEFFQNWRQILNQLDCLDVHIRDLQCLLFINKEFLNLKELNVFIYESLDKFSSYLSPSILERLRVRLRSDLKIYVYNLKLEQSTVKFICDYLNNSKNQIKLYNSEMSYKVNEYSELLFIESEKNIHLLDEFFRNIIILVFDVPIYNEKIFRLMYNVEYLNIRINNDHNFNNFELFLKTFNSLKELKLAFDTDQYDCSLILKLLPIYCWNIFSFKILNKRKINYDYSPLLELKNLKYLKLVLKNPIDENLMINLINQSKYLKFFEMCFDRSDYCDYEFIELRIKDSIHKILIKRSLKFKVLSQYDNSCERIFYTLDSQIR